MAKDFTGQVFGRLTVVRLDKSQPHNRTDKWLCKCACGQEKIISRNHLNETQSCGCLRHEIIDLTGRTFGRLTVIRREANARRTSWLCKCKCGKEKVIKSTCLTSGDTKSCGCLHRDIVKKYLGNPAATNLFGNYRRSAQRRGREFLLTRAQCETFWAGQCYWCGIKPYKIHTSEGLADSFTYNGIDRLDNTLGYIVANCVSCCKICNYAKRTLTVAEFEEWLNRILNYRSSKLVAA